MRQGIRMGLKGHDDPTLDAAYEAQRRQAMSIIRDDFTALEVRRFWYSVPADSESGCWEWLGPCKSSGDYGTFNVRRNGGQLKLRAHRVMYAMLNGVVEDDDVVLHSCDNPVCVNPYHLSVGTHADNAKDKCDRGRVRLGTAHGNAKLNEVDVLYIRESSKSGGVLAKQYGVSRSLIGSIRRRKIWRHL